MWVRHILFVKAQKAGPPAYILICDEVEAGAQPMTFAWQLHAGYPYTPQGDGVNISGHTAGLDVHLLAPSDGRFVEKQTPAPIEKQRTHFIQWRTPGDSLSRCVYLTALVPRMKKDEVDPYCPSVSSKPPAAGRWKARAGSATDLALFRSEKRSLSHSR